MFEIEPPYLFGLPKEGWTVIPAKAQTVNGPEMSSATGKVVRYGTLSSYRNEDEKIRSEFKLGGIQLQFNDNFLNVTIEGSDYSKAVEKIAPVLLYATRHMSFEINDLIQYRLVEVVDENHRRVPSHQSFSYQRVHSYDLDKIRKFTQFLESSFPILASDPRWVQALEYHERGLALSGLARQYPPLPSLSFPEKRTEGLLLPEAFLNYWKSITVILGDRTAGNEEKERYKTFYREIGLTDNAKAEIDKLYEIRNKFDVAHPQAYMKAQRPDIISIDILEEGRNKSQLVMRSYAEYMIPKNPEAIRSP